MLGTNFTTRKIFSEAGFSYQIIRMIRDLAEKSHPGSNYNLLILVNKTFLKPESDPCQRPLTGLWLAHWWLFAVAGRKRFRVFFVVI